MQMVQTRTRSNASVALGLALVSLAAVSPGRAAAAQPPLPLPPASTGEPIAPGDARTLPSPPPPPTPPAATNVESHAARAMGDLVHILVRKGRMTQEAADRLVPPGAGTRALEELARFLLERSMLTPAHSAAIDKAVEAGGPGAGARALVELVRGLFEKGELNDGELEELLSPEGVRRVTYVPELTRLQLREMVRRDVIDELKRDGWAQPNVVPKWLERLQLSGDVRVRYEAVRYPGGLDNTGYFNDIAALNAGPGFDVRGNDMSGDRYLDVDQDRYRPRVRGRLAVDAWIAPLVNAGIRIATGETNSPVSTNQTLGTPGALTKYPVWLDRAFIRVGPPAEAPSGASVVLGRFENPFFRTELVWSDDVNLDGAAVSGKLDVPFRPFAVLGAFPTYTTALNYPAELPAKFPSRDKWLFAGQVGGEWRRDRLGIKAGVALYDFYRIEGRPSSPCDTYLKGITCDTDDTRPSFAQKGNTYRTLRTPSDKALILQSNPATPQYQYFGLASSFREVVGTLRVDLPSGELLRTSVDAEYAWNAAFSRSNAASVAINNFASCTKTSCSQYAGGALAYLANLTVGSRSTDARWSWYASVGYRRIESDAVVDAFNSADFGLGGTNLKGYTASATLVYLSRVSGCIRWWSADSIVGAPYGVDVLQLDLWARF
jgi:hypothetical protein